MTVQDHKSLLPALTGQAAQLFAPLQREIDKVFSEFGRGLADYNFGPSPDMDLKETPERIELTVELPGIKADDLSVSVDDGVLTVSGEKRSETDEARKGYRMVERRYGAFSRSLKLPAGVMVEQMTADLDNGVLTIAAPREKVEPGRKVPIKASA